MGIWGMALLSGRLVLTTTSASSASTKAIAVSASTKCHRGTPEYPGRTVTLEPAEGEVCWGAAYKISKKEDLVVKINNNIPHLHACLFAFNATGSEPTLSVFRYIASPDRKHNVNYLGPASPEGIAKFVNLIPSMPLWIDVVEYIYKAYSN